LVKLAAITITSPMTNFIVPVDFSVDSLKGLEWALLFSQKQTITIQMVYVLTDSSNFQSSVAEQEHKYAQAEFKKLIKEYESRLGTNSKLKYIIKKGKVYREVVNQVNSFKNAVVSASTHGASGFEELFIGSNALKIMAATIQPVFTLRRTHVPNQIKRILLPIKLHRFTRQKATIAADLAALFGAELHVISVSTNKNKRDLERLESYAKQVVNYFNAKELKSVTKTLIGENLPSLTCNYAEAVDADLITIMSSSIDKWNVFLGSYAQQMVNKASVPLLSITPKEKQISSEFSSFGG
jgi:nucleotide-binding universal stress UspA family protein